MSSPRGSGVAPAQPDTLAKRVLGAWASLAVGVPAEVWRVSIGTAFTRIGGVLVGFAVGVVLARALGPAQYGIYGTVISVAAIASVAVSMGVPNLAMREVALLHVRRDWAGLRGLLGWSAGKMVMSVLALAAVAVAVAAFSAGGAIPGISTWLLLGISTVLYLMILVTALIRGLGAMVAGQLLDVLLRPAIFLAALLATLALGGAMDAGRAVALHMSAGILVLAIGAVMLLGAVPIEARRAEARRDGRIWLRGALPMGATEIVRSLDAHYAVIVLALVGSVAQVGEFKVAAAISLFLLLPYTIFNSVAVPVSARLFASGRKAEIQRFASLAAIVSTALAVAATLVLLLVGRFLIVAVFGEAFAPAWGVLIVLCIAQVIHSAFGINPAMLNAMGHEVTVFRWFLVSLITGVAAALVLAPAFGSHGIAWAIVLAAVVRVIPLHLHTVRRLGIDCSILAAVPALSGASLREN